MTGPVLTHLGETRLELGPLRDVEPAGAWRAARDVDGVLWLALDVADSGTNTISETVLAGLDTQLDAIESDAPKGVVLRSAKLGGFAAGADISMFRDMTEPDAAVALLERGHEVLDRLERLDCPTVCIVHGHALGGGFELALACDHIIAIEEASFGFPEVKLGLHPGLGGTFRLPARIDPLEAMTLMLTGKTAHTKKAKSLGIVDAVVEERHVEAAVRAALAGELKHDGQGLTGRAMSLSAARSFAARKMRQRTEEQAPKQHYPAPYALIDLWEEHGDDRQKMQKAEVASFANLLATETSKNLVRVFFLRQGLKAEAVGDDGIAHVHVVGAGTMGAEIAAWCAINGKTVSLSDPDIAALGKAVKTAVGICRDRHLDDIETRNALDRIVPDPEEFGVGKADLVIEAGPEDPKIKSRIYAELEPRMRPAATLATNTSSLSVESLAKNLARPRRFAGLHFFNPVSKVPLIEVVTHPDTFGTVKDQLAAFCGAIDRLPAKVGDYPGFLVNRALTPYLLEAIQLIEEGHSKESIDSAAEVFGMPMGPVELADQIGLDICIHVADSLRSALDKPMPAVPDTLREKVENGDTGRKSGEGFYVWKDGKAQKPGVVANEDAEVTDRLILPMLDACVECLRLGVAKDADQIDAALIFGAGFAPFRGGPLHYAKQRGTKEIVERMEQLRTAHGDRFEPDPGWSGLG